MKKSFTPKFGSKIIIKTKSKSTLQFKAPKLLVNNIMEYVNSTQELTTLQLGDLKLFLN